MKRCKNTDETHGRTVLAVKKLSSDYKLLTGTFFRLLPYQVLLIVISAVNGIVDSIYASNAIGTEAMSAIGLYGPLNHFLYAASMMLVSGTQVLYGRYLARDRTRIQSLFMVNLTVSLIISLLTALAMVLGVVTNFVSVIVNEEPDLQFLKDYMLGQAIGIPALVIGQQLFAFLSMENQTKRTMTASLICFVSNAIMDHVCIVFIPMGTFGLGLSSAISTWIFLGVQAVYYLSGKSEWKFSIRSLSSCRWKDASDICRLGYSGALSRFVEVFRCLIVNALVLRYVGSIGLSAFAASNSLLAVVWAVPFGMVSVVRMLLSISYGEEDRRSLVDAMRVLLTRGMLLQCLIVVALVAAAEPLTMLFYRNPAEEVYGMTVMGFRILPLCMPFAVVSLSFAAYTQIVNKKVLKVVLPIVDGLLGVTLCSLFLIPAMGMNGLYIANVINGLICCLLLFTFSWVEKKSFPRSVEGLMAIPDSFGVPAEDRMDLTVRTMDEVTTVSENVMSFCAARGVDPRHSFFAGLCLEEMAGNIIQYGFPGNKKQHSIDIRVSRRPDGLILRLRDNCPAFDPGTHNMITVPSEKVKNVGIPLVYNLAEKVEYQNLLGLNVLTIRL